MISDLCLFMLFVHVIGDFQAQTRGMAEHKATGRGMLMHAGVLSLLSALAGVLIWLFGMPAGGAFFIVLTLLILHLMLDILKQWLTRFCRANLKDSLLFAADQLLHVLLIVLVVDVLFAPHAGLIMPLSRPLLKWMLLIALVTKPANICFKVIFERYQLNTGPDAAPNDLPEPGAGALIGSLERLLAALFFSLGQYAAVGLVFTAKSIARFRQIDENKRFAEYYLIGTLFSMLYVLLAYLLIFHAVA